MVSEPSSSELSKSADTSSLPAKLRTSKRVSWLLDECIRIPGTEIRFGLDPILGLLPYGGETVATIIGAVILGDAGKKGLPLKTLIKMGGNMLVNAGVGAIPVVGDLFSVWFKSNSRNYKMLNTFIDSEKGEEAPGGWWPVIFIMTIVGIVLILNFLSWVFIISFGVWMSRQLGGAA